MVKKNNRLILFLGIFALLFILSGIYLIFPTGNTQQLQYPLGLLTEETQTQQNYFLNISVLDESNNPIENTFVIVFEDTTARVYGYTNKSGVISFTVPEGSYLVQFEKYKYEIASEYITLSENTDHIQHINSQNIVLFGIPSWIIMTIIGLCVVALVYSNRKYFKLTGWKKPTNWFGRAKQGQWTFIDKSTKAALYGMFLALLFILIAFIIPNIPSLEQMSYYYVALGFISFILLIVEGQNKKYPIAALGFGKKQEIGGDIAIGIIFALLFIGFTGFASQLSFFSLSDINSIATLFVVIFVASFFEEAFHSGILAPTIAEKAGIVPSIIITGLIFMSGHGLVYGWAFAPLLIAFIYRLIATSIVLYKKSWAGMFVTHLMINTLSLFTLLMFTRM